MNAKLLPPFISKYICSIVHTVAAENQGVLRFRFRRKGENQLSTSIYIMASLEDKEKGTKDKDKGDPGELRDPDENASGKVNCKPVNKSCSTWTQKICNLVRTLHSFEYKSLRRNDCVPFVVNGTQVGLVLPKVLNQLEFHNDVFFVVRDLLTKKVKYVSMATDLDDKTKRSCQFNNVMRDWRDRDIFSSLRGWRNEKLSVKESFSSETLIEVERSACCLFGFHTYGVHINGYIRNDSSDVYMWIARRSIMKQTYPGKLDNTVAGCISSDEGVLRTVVRECMEEAGIPEKLALTARPAGTVNYFLENEDGLLPETQFVFDLELPRSFEPTNTDGEVSDYYLLPMAEVKELIATDEFKPNCALVLLDFFLRHGAINPDTEPNYVYFTQGCRRKLLY